MPRVGALAPYALAAAVVLGVSALGLAFALERTGVAEPEPAAAKPTPPAFGTPQPLSATERLAYWRDNTLWASNLDGSLLQPVTQIDNSSRVSLTRWTPDGGAIAFVESRVILVVVSLDGSRIEIAPTPEQRVGGLRIVDLHWSPDGTAVAATMQRPQDTRTDVYIARVSSGVWLRATDLEDAFAGPWVSEDELLVHTASGIVGVLREGGMNDIRPLTHLRAASPILGDDGRVHFLVGQVGTAGAQPTTIRVNDAIVWSTTIDATDLRQETSVAFDGIRLDGRWPDGRYLVHHIDDDDQLLLEGTLAELPSAAGDVERVSIAPDGRFVYGFARARIIRIDAGRPADAPGAVAVLLDSIHDADVWFRPSLNLARGTTPSGERPNVRYAFRLSPHLWTMEPDGTVAFLRAGTLPVRARTAQPALRWAPSGRLVSAEPFNSGAPPLVPVLIERDGFGTRITRIPGVGPRFALSPDGAVLAVVVDRRGASSPTLPGAQPEVRFVALDGGEEPEAIAGSEVAWSAGGLFVLGTDDDGLARRVDLVQGAEIRTVTDVALLAASPFGADIAEADAQLSGLAASADGAYVAVVVTAADAVPARLTVVDVADGSPLFGASLSSTPEAAWSPAAPLLGYTDRGLVTTEAVVVRTDGTDIARHEGRFAGWSPDGEWYYVARTQGLFAHRLGGDDPVRISPVGVSVVTTAP
ncbi:MAG: TolB family protein [Candidatus Limnocylindria bacterium]